MHSNLSRIGLVLGLLITSALSADDRPNILFIFADDQNYKTLSCYDGAPEWVNTPNIDALAEKGVRFHRTYFGAWCMPSRASFLTGRLQHGVATMRMVGQYPGSTYDPEKCRFVPSEFRKQGYHTAQIGKWHTGVDTGNGRDWDHQMVWNRPGKPDNAGNYFHNQIITVNGKDMEPGGYATDNYTNWAIDYIKGENRDADKPWYLWVCYGAVHGPTTPADRHKGKLTGKQPTVPEDIFGPWPDKGAYLESISSWIKGDDGKPYRRKRNLDPKSNFNTNTAGQPFDDWVQQVNECEMAVDEGVGRLMETLRETGQLDNTFVVYAADQGFALGEHGMNQKVAPYDAAIASPLILYYEGKLPEGKVCKHPINAPDLMQYFCDVAQVDIPWKTHGRDITPLLQNPEGAEWKHTTMMTHTGRSYGEYTETIPTDESMYVVGGVPWYVMTRNGKFKYVRYLVEGETEELYDLEKDPEELTNLASNPKHQKRLANLRKKAIKELKRTDAPFANSMPNTKQMSGE